MTHRDNTLIDLEPLLKELKIEGKVLEIGQGLDTQMREFLESKGFEYYATDNYIGVNNGNDRLLGKEYHYNKMESLTDFEDEVFDLVFVCHAFEHCERPVDALKEFKRVLKKDGVVIIVTPYPCKHHIIDADFDHIMVLSDMQMLRLLVYSGYKGVQSQVFKHWDWKEQDWNVLSVGKK